MSRAGSDVNSRELQPSVVMNSLPAALGLRTDNADVFNDESQPLMVVRIPSLKLGQGLVSTFIASKLPP